MRKYFASKATGKIICSEDDHTPVCQKDFCDTCGDCLHCFGGDPCVEGNHFWVKYIRVQNGARSVRIKEKGEK